MYYSVTSDNLFDVLPAFESETARADFIAFDFELTGLSDEKIEGDASPEVIFDSIKSGALKFAPLQLGVCTFRYDEADCKPSTTGHANASGLSESSEDACRVSIFEFYLRPHAASRTYESFACQAASIAMLADTGFAFDRSFTHGIPLLTLADERELRTRLESLTQMVGARRTYEQEAIHAELHCKHMAWFSPPTNSNCVQEYEQRLSSLLRTEVNGGDVSNDNAVPCVRFERLSAFERKVLDSVLHSLNACDSLYAIDAPRLEQLWRFVQPSTNDAVAPAPTRGRTGAPGGNSGPQGRTGLSSLRSCSDCTDVLVYKVTTAAHFRAVQMQRLLAYREQLDAATVFRTHVAARLAHARALVAHNALLDCAHLLHSCFAPRSLRNVTLPQLRALLRETFNAPMLSDEPHALSTSGALFDTKFLACNMQLPSEMRRPFCTSLRGLCQFIAQPSFRQTRFQLDSATGKGAVTLPQTLVDANGQLNVDRVVQERLHSAGFDAFATGMCFAALARYTYETVSPPIPALKQHGFAYVLRHNAQPLHALRNRIFHARMLNRRCLIFEPSTYGKQRTNSNTNDETLENSHETATTAAGDESTSTHLEDLNGGDDGSDAAANSGAAVHKRTRKQSGTARNAAREESTQALKELHLAPTTAKMETDSHTASKPNASHPPSGTLQKRKKQQELFTSANEWN